MLYLWFSRTGGYIHMLVVYCMRSRLRSRHSVTTSVEDHDIWRPDRSDRRTSDSIETHGFHSKCCAYGSVWGSPFKSRTTGSGISWEIQAQGSDIVFLPPFTVANPRKCFESRLPSKPSINSSLRKSSLSERYGSVLGHKVNLEGDESSGGSRAGLFSGSSGLIFHLFSS